VEDALDRRPSYSSNMQRECCCPEAYVSKLHANGLIIAEVGYVGIIYVN